MERLDKTFLSRIGPRYGHLVHSLIALNSSATNTLAALPLLSNLRHVVLESTRLLAECLRQEDAKAWTGYDAVPYVEAATSRLLADVTSVSVTLDGAHDTLRLCSGPSLTRLEVMLARPGGFVLLANALRSCPALSPLELTVECKSSPTGALIMSTDPTPTLSSPPSLRRLHVRSSYYSPGLVPAISRIGQSIIRLSLDIRSDHDSASFFPEGVCWPNVHTLVLSDYYNASNPTTASILREATPAVFPRLENFVWLTSHDEEAAGSGCLRALRSFIGARAGTAVPLNILLETDRPTIASRHFVLVNEGATGHSARVRIEHVVTSDSYLFALKVDEPFLVPNVREDDLDIHDLHRMLDRLFMYSADQADQALAVADRQQLERMVRAATELEYLRTEASVLVALEIELFSMFSGYRFPLQAD